MVGWLVNWLVGWLLGPRAYSVLVLANPRHGAMEGADGTIEEAELSVTRRWLTISEVCRSFQISERAACLLAVRMEWPTRRRLLTPFVAVQEYLVPEEMD